MATVKFTGQAPLVAQVDTFTPGGTIEVGDIFTLTISGMDGSTESVSFAATATTAANVAAGLVAAWNAATGDLMSAITASGTVTVILTADTAGAGFSVAGTTTEAGGGAADDQTFTRVATVANSGPSDWNCAANWDSGVVPGGSASQDVYVEDATILYGLNQSGTAQTLASLNILRSQIGSDPASGCLPVYLQVKATAVNLGMHFGPGTSSEVAPINIDTGSTASTITVYNTGTNSTSTMTGIRLKSNSASTVMHFRKCLGGVGYSPGETTTVGTINISYDTNQDDDANVYIGAGVTLTTLNKNGGNCLLMCGATAVNNNAGNLQTEGSGVITTLTCRGGIVTANSTGTITNLNSIDNGEIDLTKSQKARTVTTPKVGGGGKISHDPSVVTMTNPIARYDTGGIIQVQAV